MYTMAIQILAAFQLKITKIGDDIAKKQIFPQTLVIFGPYFAQIVFKISKLCSKYPNFLRYASTDRVLGIVL